MDSRKVWFVTGASRGLGLTLIKELLDAGFYVAATSRKASALIEAVGEAGVSGGPGSGGVDETGVGHRDGGFGGRFLPLEVSLTQETSVQRGIEAALAHFGKIDVVVNNAGYGQTGTLEETSDQEARQNFDINVFGALNVIRRVMPHFRARRAGMILNIGSVGGYVGGFPGWGIYCATKFAVAGFTEALAAEVKEFGVKAVAVYPGYFRTEFLSEGSMALPAAPIHDYSAARQSLSIHQHQLDGQQQGDPVKAAAVLMRVAEAENPPLHLFLGKDAYELVEAKIAEVRKDLSDWEKETVSTGF